MTCSGCSELLDPGWRFCPVCGLEAAWDMKDADVVMDWGYVGGFWILDMHGNPITQWHDATEMTEAIEQLIRETGGK